MFVITVRLHFPQLSNPTFIYVLVVFGSFCSSGWLVCPHAGQWQWSYRRCTTASLQWGQDRPAEQGDTQHHVVTGSENWWLYLKSGGPPNCRLRWSSRTELVKPDWSFLLLLHIALYSSVNNLVHIKCLAQLSTQEIRYEKRSALNLLPISPF